ncbi:unnamed protein product, partial [Brugia pahangi]|uniref:Transmembrane protein n=1 Tax=Brugia pahangi TaxID=6280 RepID=A0A0N4TBB2_BRUPA
WALFYLNQPTLIFSSAAQYTFLDEKQTIGIDLSEKLLLKLNGATKENQISDNNWTSVICKVEIMQYYISQSENCFITVTQCNKRSNIIMQYYLSQSESHIFYSNLTRQMQQYNKFDTVILLRAIKIKHVRNMQQFRNV